ncbi:MAG TPA: TerC family protein [Verrucomicrobiota bacterium]|nr:TerC family protein [Verrucomicrobiota bacterium]
MTDNTWLWIGFNVFILAMLALDLGVFHRKSHVVSLKESLTWTGVWVVLALLFNAGVWHYAGSQKALEFFTGYLIEKSLSVDNVFVFALLFSYFAVPPKYQHKVLFWGILGALIMRAIMIALGAALITKFAWIIYFFGAFLILTGIKMIVKREEEIHPERNPIVRWFKKLMPVTPDYRGDKFFVREVAGSAGGPPAASKDLADEPSAIRSGRRVLMATPLFVVLLLVEFTDLIFAVDSIPAIFAVTKDPFIVYTSNVFAILGLRSLYFALAGVMDKFHYLKVGLGAVLSFVGVKMILAHTAWKIDTLVSLGVIVLILTTSVVWSLFRLKKTKLVTAVSEMPVTPAA